MPPLTLFLSAGEVSGDMHGAHLARALKAMRPDVRLIGVGGPHMAAAGVEILADVIAHSAVGLTENLPHVMPVMKACARSMVIASNIASNSSTIQDP